MDRTLPNQWITRPLEQCMDAIIDYRGKTPRKSSFGVPLITAKIVKNGRILEPDEFIPFEDYDDRMQRGIPKAGDILVTTEGPLGEIAQLDDKKVSIGQRIITLRCNENIIYNDFLKYLMMSDYIQEQLVSRSSGTTVAGIKQSELRKIDLLIPPLSVQRRIADILGALDDKIELNHRMNRTLESMARAMFTEISNNNIPPKIIKLGDICEFVYGKSLIDKDRIMGNIPVIGSNGQIGWHDQALVQGPGIVVGRKGNPGTVTWVNTDFFPIDTTFYINVKTTEINLYWLFFALKSLNLPSLNADSAVPGLNRNIAYQSELVFPPKEKVQSFLRYVKPIFSLIENNNSEVVLLKLIRDIAIKRLISSNLY
jgi:type I restriction enzyme S subunit